MGGALALRFVTGSLTFASPECAWCQDRNCSIRKNIANPASAGKNVAIPGPFAATASGRRWSSAPPNSDSAADATSGRRRALSCASFRAAANNPTHAMGKGDAAFAGAGGVKSRHAPR